MTAKREARFEKLRESSMQRIEDAALELFANNGYGHTSISQIARKAGISKGLMYNYYDSKEALLQAIVRKGLDFSDRLLEMDAGLKEIAPEEWLKILIEASIDEILNNPEYWKLMTALAFQEEVMKTVAPDVDRKKAEHLAMGKTIFKQLGYPHPEAQALLFAGALDGMFMHYILSPEEYPLAVVKELLIGQFCRPYKK